MTEDTHHIARPSCLLLGTLLICEMMQPMFGFQNIMQYSRNKRMFDVGPGADLKTVKRMMSPINVIHGFTKQSKEMLDSNDQLDSNYDEYPVR